MILIKLQVFAVQDFLLTSNFRFENTKGGQRNIVLFFFVIFAAI
ncbi:Uncharacterised protein [Bacteroides eggerthii]|uniref:Uncharacterized protein n=1 Tax=Bacteroides eggerthii TaxID=28111 RepID=A0A380Z9S1_9BACE|nr:Uncharacterised protein [Bacteroides eggerthii]